MRSLSLFAFASVFALAACSAPADAPSEGADTVEVAEGVTAEAGVGATASVIPGTEACFETDMAAALRDVCVLSADVMAGRLVGTEANALARAYLIERYEALGLEPVGESFVHAFDFERAIDFRNPDAGRKSFTGYNLIGRIPGADSSRAMAVTAHYDHVGPGENNEIFNGADDNASGVGGMLAVAEHFIANPPEHDVLIIAFDAEEGGLNGARAFVAEPPAGAAPVVLNYNLDMLGYSPDGDIWAAGSYHTPALLPVIEAAAESASITLAAGYDRPTGDPREDWTLLSDHGPFHVAGIPFLYLGVEDHEHYHRPSDEFSIIDPVFYAGVVALSVDLAERMDDALPAIVASAEAAAEPETSPK
jgi:Zn-dependent M28 family amino/carboxypeptidase